MMLTVETPTGVHKFTGNVKTKNNGGTLKIMEGEKEIAVFREWANWITTQEDKNK